MADVVALLGETASQVRRGELDAKVAGTLTYIAATAVRALQQGDIEARLLAIEARLAGRAKERGHESKDQA